MRRYFQPVLSLTALIVLGASTLLGQFKSASPAVQAPPTLYPPQYNSEPYSSQQTASGPNGSFPQNGSYSGSGAQQPEVFNEQDPAGDRQHGVARISVLQGDVNVRRGDSGELVAAVANVPLVTQDHLQTSPGSRAEVQFDSFNIVRLGQNTDLGFADLEYGRYRVQVGAGSVIYRVLGASDAQVEIDTPSIAVRPVGPGEYRVTILDDGSTQLSVHSGRAELDGPRGSEQVAAGQSVLVRGNPSDPEFQNTYLASPDQLDDWSQVRDDELANSQSYRYVDPSINGAADLDNYGNWVPSPYGQVWAPQQPVADWSPYSSGNWTWLDYYGWTWVDNAPWGWAPYHYGRWFWNTGYGWCWWPGARGFHHWSPALVGFYGYGGTGARLGGLGWVALAPYEAFHPWWGRGLGHAYGLAGYGRGDYSFARGVNVLSLYRNAAFRGGAISVAADHFGGPGQRYMIASRGQLMSASLFRGTIPSAPGRASFLFTNRTPVANPRFTASSNRTFFRYQPSIQRSQPSTQYTPRRTYPSGTNSASPGTGWQRFGDPGSSSTLRQGFNGGQESSGWHTFGGTQPSGSSPYSRSQDQTPPRGNRSYSPGSYSNGYAARPFSTNQYRSNQTPQNAPGYSGRPAYSAPQRYTAPQQQHYEAPRSNSGSPRTYSGGGSHSSASGSPSRSGGGGGGHSSSGGRHGR